MNSLDKYKRWFLLVLLGFMISGCESMLRSAMTTCTTYYHQENIWRDADGNRVLFPIKEHSDVVQPKARLEAQTELLDYCQNLLNGSKNMFKKRDWRFSSTYKSAKEDDFRKLKNACKAYIQTPYRQDYTEELWWEVRILEDPFVLLKQKREELLYQKLGQELGYSLETRQTDSKRCTGPRFIQ